MSENGPLDLERIMGLVGDAMALLSQGVSVSEAASTLVTRSKPSVREIAAARQQNHEVHGGGTPEILRPFFKPTPVPEDVLRMRRMIDEVLTDAERRLGA